MVDLIKQATAYVQSALAEQANPEKAAGMQAYMKTEMPFYGVQSPGLVPIIRHVVKNFSPSTRGDYERLVLALWRLPHREEKYIAQRVAVKHRRFIVPASLPLYRRFIVEGAWWDFVDEAVTIRSPAARYLAGGGGGGPPFHARLPVGISPPTFR